MDGHKSLLFYLYKPLSDEYLRVGKLVDLLSAQLLALLQQVQHLVILLHGSLMVFVQNFRNKVLPVQIRATLSCMKSCVSESSLVATGRIADAR